METKKEAVEIWVLEYNPHQRHFHLTTIGESLFDNRKMMTDARLSRERHRRRGDCGCWVPIFIGSYEKATAFSEDFKQKTVHPIEDCLYQRREDGFFFIPDLDALRQFALDHEWDSVFKMEEDTNTLRDELIGKWIDVYYDGLVGRWFLKQMVP
jgi:hypothetical protein